MLNIGDYVQVIDAYAILGINIFQHIGIITEVVPPTKNVNIPMYDVHINNEVYVLFDDEVTLLTCGLH